MSLLLISPPRYKSGLKEAQILHKLQKADEDPNKTEQEQKAEYDRKHLIRLERTFEHRGHLCLVFESFRCAPLI